MLHQICVFPRPSVCRQRRPVHAKTVETSDERLKLMFRVKARIPPELLQQHLEYVKTGLPGVAWVRVNEELPWPDDLVVRLPQ